MQDRLRGIVSETASIKIGPWIASPALNLLESGTRSVRLEPRAMDVLMVLARRDGAVVSVEELMSSVWKGVIVGDGSVYLAIRQLRQALGDDNGVSYIETIPKRGYRLTVPVEFLETGRAPASTVPQTKLSSLRWVGAALIGAIIVGAVIFASIPRNAAQPASAHSVAVLPFDNLSSDPEQAYFADGITVELVNALSRVRGLKVTGRVSSFHFKDRIESPRAIGEALGVEHVLEGSVRKSGDRVRIAAQLVNARTGDRLWSETYERRFDDVFSIQDEIATSVANALQIKLGVGDLARVPGMTRNVAAYDEYLRGMTLNIQWTPESFPPAIVHLERAVEIDPSFSVAWAGLHTVYVNGAAMTPDHAEEWRSNAAQALERARALTPDAPHVLLEIGIDESRRGQWLEAAQTFDRLQASYARYGMSDQAWGPRGTFLLAVGRVREAIPALERARTEEPLAVAFASFLGQADLADGNLAGAMAQVDRGLKLGGLETILHRAGLVIALTKNDRAEVRKRLDAMPENIPAVEISRKLAHFIDAPDGAAAEIRSLAANANTVEKTMLAQWAAFFHEPELSLELLTDVAPRLSHPGMLWLPLLRDVRKLPGFKDLVRERGFVDYWHAYGWSDFCRPLGEEDFACG